MKQAEGCQGSSVRMYAMALGCSVMLSISYTQAQVVHVCGFTSYSAASWDAVPGELEAAAYLSHHFNNIFPNGLYIGCDTKIVLQSETEILDFLKNSSNETLWAPFGRDKFLQVLLTRELIATSLNVGFDAFDPEFSPTHHLLGDVVINRGEFRNWSVSRLLDEANAYIGGCSSDFSAQQLYDALLMLNTSFETKNNNTGYLLCKPGEFKKLPYASEKFLLQCIYPDGTGYNPVIRITGGQGNIEIRINDMMGKLLRNITVITADPSEPVEIHTEPLNLASGTYVVTAMQNEVSVQEKLQIVK